MLEVGRIDRPHGVRGEVLVTLTTNRTERVDPGSVLTAPSGPLTVASSRPHKARHIVRFEGVADRDAAEALQGSSLSAPPIDDPDELWVHELIGAEVVDGDGVGRGRVESVLDNPASDLLVLDTGHLVPARFVVGLEPGVRVDVEAPAGLFGGAEEAR